MIFTFILYLLLIVCQMKQFKRNNGPFFIRHPLNILQKKLIGKANLIWIDSLKISSDWSVSQVVH